MRYFALGVKTAHKLGVVPFICIILGLLCIFSSMHDIALARSEGNKPCELTVYGNITDEMVMELSNLSGVLKCTGVYEMTSEMTSGDYHQSLTVYGIDGAYIDQCDEVYPSISSMPFVILNKKASQSFTDDYGKPVLSENIRLESDCTLNGRVSLLTSVIDDNRTVPVAYISPAAAKLLLADAGVRAQYSFAFIKAESIADGDRIVEAIGNSGFQASSNTAEVKSNIASLNKVGVSKMLGGVVGLLGALVCIIGSRNKTYKKAELKMLRYCGVMRSSLSLIIVGRLTAYILCAFILSWFIYTYFLNFAKTVV